MAPTVATLHWIDGAILGIYFFVIFVVGIYFGPIQSLLKRIQHQILMKKMEEDSSRSATSPTQQFFLANRDVTFFAIGCSLFASNIGSEHFIGLAASGAREGLCVSWGEWLSPLFILMLGFLFAPFYLRAKVYTLPEFIEKRFSSSCRILLSAVSLFMYMMTKICVSIYAGTIVLRLILHWQNVWFSALVLVLITGVYTVSGGLNAVIYTEVIQTIILICGGVTVFFFSIYRVGGWYNLVNLMDSSANPPIHQDPSFNGYGHLVQPPSHKNFPITGVLFGMPFVSMWYWVTDQVIVQRVLCAKNTNHAKGGTILAGFLKILPPFIMVIPGMTARILIPHVVQNDPNSAFVALISEVLPIGFRGLMYAALLAALMSSLASVFHSSSTLFTMDIYRKFRSYLFSFINQIRGTYEDQETSFTCSEYEYVIVGKIAGSLITVFGILWIPLVPLLSQELYVYTHKVMSYMAPPISIVFLFGVCFKRVNATGAILTLILGWVIGIGRLILEVNVVKHQGTCSVALQTDTFSKVMAFFVCINFLHFAAIVSLLLMILIIVASFAFSPPTPEQVDDLTVDWYQLKNDILNFISFKHKNYKVAGSSLDKGFLFWEGRAMTRMLVLLAAALLICCLLSLYIFFR
jgi:SSS family solute:Na+ symporter